MVANNQPLVSIVIPTYNGLLYLEEAVESILAQDYPHIELIVLDDGSTDETSSFLEKYRGRFYFESHPNMGQANTLNKGWKLSKGEILGYLSADDVLAKDAVRVSVECFLQNPNIVMTYGDNFSIDSESKIIQKLKAPEYDYHSMIYFGGESQIGAGSFFLKKIFDQIGGWDSSYKLIPDYVYHVKLAQWGEFKHIPKVLGYYRVHDASISLSTASFEKAEEPKKIMEYIINTTNDHNLLREKNKLLSYGYLRSGRSHWRSNRYQVGFKYFIRGIYLFPRNLFTMLTYRILLNALFGRNLRKIINKILNR